MGEADARAVMAHVNAKLYLGREACQILRDGDRTVTGMGEAGLLRGMALRPQLSARARRVTVLAENSS